MWANCETAAFLEWLKEYSEKLTAGKRIGFYVYSFSKSMNSIIEYIEKNDPKALEIAKTAMESFEPSSQDIKQSYAGASAFVPVFCRKEILTMLT